MALPRFSLPAAERLKSRKKTQELFHKGSSFFCYPFKVLALPNEAQVPVQVLFTVPKKHFRKAVERNRIKRLAREAFRLEKTHFAALPIACIGFIFVAKQEVPLSELRQKMQRLAKDMAKAFPSPSPN